MKSIVKVIDTINRFCEYLLGGITLLLAFLVLFEVICRYFLGKPTLWSMEVNTYLFCGLSLLGGGYCLLEEGHVRVDLFYPKFSPKTQAIVEMSTFILPLLFCVVLAWLGGREFWATLIENRRSDGVLALPLWPVWITMPLAGFLLGIQIVSRYLKNIMILNAKE